MLFRKIENTIKSHLLSISDRIMVVEGARQIGKSYIIRKVGSELFANFIEINLLEDKEGPRLFENVHTVEDFYLQIGMIAGGRLGNYNDTLIFLDEIQAYPNLLTLLKFLRQEKRFHYIASGSLLGISLHQSLSVPLGSIEIIKMYPLDFEEFIIANGVDPSVIKEIYKRFSERKSLSPELHKRMLDLFKKYLLSGGLPQAVNAYLKTHNIVEVRRVQDDIRRLYKVDATQYDIKNRLHIKRIYEMIPSQMEDKKKRIHIKDIENKIGKRFSDYKEGFDYLIDSGITLEVRAVTTPRFPLIESGTKNLLKLYLNDIGLLTSILYQNNIRAVLDDEKSINLGAVYESVVAQELAAHGFTLYYYDNKKNGEVDYLIDNYATLSTIPIEVKSGKDYSIHSALSKFIENADYNVKEAFVLCNSYEVKNKGNITYLPIYYVMCINNNLYNTDIYF